MNIKFNKDIKKEEKNYKESINNIDNNNNIKKTKLKNEIKNEKNETNIISSNEKENIIQYDEKQSEQININDINAKNLKRQNSNLNMGIKSSSLYNVFNVQKSFNCFRNNNANKKINDHKTVRNIFNANNKIIKNNSIKIYSSMIKKEFSDLAKKEKEKEYNFMNKEEDKAKNSNRKEPKKSNSITDANIQLISINNNNIIINHINNNFSASTVPNKILTHKNISKINRKNSEKNNSGKDNILFPDLKIKKNSPKKGASTLKEVNNNFIKDNAQNENKIFSQKLVNSKRQRPFSSRVFKQHINKNISGDLNNNNNNIKKLNNRPLTGLKPNFNNNSNVMNININFYNIDMNRRFLAPEINPLHSNDFDNFKEKSEVIKRGGSKSNINLKEYQNNNEFIFQKLIKAIQDINNDKKLTINDLH
jgi:hypothetical protein